MPCFSKTSRFVCVAIAVFLAIDVISGCKSITAAAPVTAGADSKQIAAVVSNGTYVALGDSYAAAPLASNQVMPPIGCLRSDEDYPALLAKALHPRSFADASCYGASTYDMTHGQRTVDQTNSPQLNALSAADSLVTVQVGGDDIGFSRILYTCGVLSLTDPFGSPCKDHYTSGGTDQLALAIAAAAPRVTMVLRQIRQRAPHARVLLIGYPDILPTTGGGCWPWVPFARGDVPYLRGVETELNAMLAAAAARTGTGYVDTYRETIGHDACQHTDVKWIEGLVPTSLAVPMHPNASGEQAMARIILAALH